jgi:hypothetical protein
MGLVATVDRWLGAKPMPAEPAQDGGGEVTTAERADPTLFGAL